MRSPANPGAGWLGLTRTVGSPDWADASGCPAARQEAKSGEQARSSTEAFAENLTFEQGSLRLFAARWLLPVVAPPIECGAVAVRDGRIIDVGDRRVLSRTHGVPATDLGEAVILPGLVNAHVHLEWSHVRGKIRPKRCFADWLRAMIVHRYRPTADRTRRRAVERALSEVVASGAVAVGEVTNYGKTVSPLASGGLLGVVFVELLDIVSNRQSRAEEAIAAGEQLIAGFPIAADLSYCLTPHAPHTVTVPLMRMLAGRSGRLSIHAAESREEVDYLENGRGAFEALIGSAWDEISWAPPHTTPVRYLERLGLLSPETMLVHCVWVDDEEIALLRDRGASVCLCPRSNRWTSAGVPPVEKLVAAGVNLALGTDSLASNEDLDIRKEMARISSIAPALPPSAVVRMATLGGACALGMDGSIGSLESGKMGRVVAVRAACGSIGDPESFVVHPDSNQVVERL